MAWDYRQHRWQATAPAGKPRLLVLVDGGCGSDCEYMTSVLAAQPGTVIAGENTYGVGQFIQPGFFILPNSRVKFRIALGMNIPMYVAPAGEKAAPKPAFSTDTSADAQPRLRISNEGTGNLRLANLTVTQEDNKLAELEIFVVLPGATAFVNLPADRVVPGRALRVQAQSNGGPVDVSVPPSKR